MATPYFDIINEWLNRPTPPVAEEAPPEDAYQRATRSFFDQAVMGERGTLQPATRGAWGDRTPAERFAALDEQMAYSAPGQYTGFGLGGIGGYGGAVAGGRGRAAAGLDIGDRAAKIGETLARLEEIAPTLPPDARARYTAVRDSYTKLSPYLNHPRYQRSPAVLQQLLALEGAVQSPWQGLGEGVGTIPGTTSFGQVTTTPREAQEQAEADALGPAISKIEETKSYLTPTGQKVFEDFRRQYTALIERGSAASDTPLSREQLRSAKSRLSQDLNAVDWAAYRPQQPVTNQYVPMPGNPKYQVWIDANGVMDPKTAEPIDKVEQLPDGSSSVWDGFGKPRKIINRLSTYEKAAASMAERADALYGELLVDAQQALPPGTKLTPTQRAALRQEADYAAASAQSQYLGWAQRSAGGEPLDPNMLRQEDKVRGETRLRETKAGMKQLQEAGNKALRDIQADGQQKAAEFTKRLTLQQSEEAKQAAMVQLRNTAVAEAGANGPAQLAARAKYWWVDDDISALVEKARVLPRDFKMDVNEARALPAGVYRLGPGGSYALKLLDGPNSPIIQLPDSPEMTAGYTAAQRMLDARQRAAQSTRDQSYPLTYAL